MGATGGDDPAEDSAGRFCADFLAELRGRGVSFRRAEVLSGWGKSTIAAAGRGPSLPNIDLVVDVLGAIGAGQAEVASWRDRHRHLRSMAPASSAAEGPSTSSPSTPVPAVAPGPGLRSVYRRRLEVAAFLAVALVAVGLGVVLALRSGNDGLRTVVVQNKVAFGPSSLIEDDSPSYLGARPVARCANLPGCKLAGTDVYSGDTLRAACQLSGEFITNADVTSVGIGQNPNAATSSLWLGVDAPDGRRGYISEVYLAPPYRGGLGLSAC